MQKIVTTKHFKKIIILLFFFSMYLLGVYSIFTSPTYRISQEMLGVKFNIPEQERKSKIYFQWYNSWSYYDSMVQYNMCVKGEGKCFNFLFVLKNKNWILEKVVEK